MSARSPRRPR
uniref:Uncharacterized protein n=1 Tax=Arundo donax TaxID=35708 RepID=A0A0A9E9S1_ARUDO